MTNEHHRQINRLTTRSIHFERGAYIEVASDHLLSCGWHCIPRCTQDRIIVSRLATAVIKCD